MSHFPSQCLFCFFAEDVGQLPGYLFQRLVGNQAADAATLQGGATAKRKRWPSAR
ncbi:MAG: hypothetical protein KA375_14890 [Vitreoscilla sp.]|nr:hypothetical protein [Burkholderiales bacterium]MBP6338884.1 hypothetical protein [Vitreoscilla sp.]